MKSCKAIDITGHALNHKIAVEVNTDTDTTQATIGRLTEWTGVTSPSSENYDTLFRAVLETGDGKAKAQIFLAPGSLVWVFEEGEAMPATFSKSEMN